MQYITLNKNENDVYTNKIFENIMLKFALNKKNKIDFQIKKINLYKFKKSKNKKKIYHFSK